MFDFEHSVAEDRYIAIGKVGDVLLVVFTERKDAIRLISVRLATNAERELYYDPEAQWCQARERKNKKDKTKMKFF